MNGEQETIRTTRFSGADWSTELKNIYLIGLGGIGSYVAYNLARIGHNLILIDGDVVDTTNVNGGQLYRAKDVGKNKVDCIQEICREFGAIGSIDPYAENYEPEGFDSNDIVICGLDNMKARKEVFSTWIEHVDKLDNPENCLLLDGRLLIENMEIFALRGDDYDSRAKYEKEHLFDDSEVADLDCTSKQSSFGAMTIAGLMTATLCNFLTNRKLGMEFRSVPVHQKLYLPLFKHDVVEQIVAEEALV
jgi:hypothetical protein